MRHIAFICIWLSFALHVHAGDAVVVRVGGYDFPPFVDTSSGQPAGLTLDLISALNTSQNKYRFDFFLTSPQRRYQDFDKGHYDIILFENILWGWDTRPVDVSRVFLTGGEVYIAKALPGRGQRYFDSLAGKSKAGILGYHYGLANFDASPEILKQKYQMRLYTDHRRLIDTVLSGKVDMAVVSASFLSYHLKKNPSDRPRLLISNFYDQTYRHTALVRKGALPDVTQIDQLLDVLKGKGLFEQIRKKYGILKSGDQSEPKGPLVIGVSFAIPPYVIKDTDQGIELDILREAFAVTGHQVKIKYLPLIRTFALLEAGKIDGVINIKPGMLDGVFYSDVVITFQNCAISLAKKDYPDFKDWSFLKDKSILAFQRAHEILGKDFKQAIADNDRYEEVADQKNQVIRLFLERNADLIVMEKQIFNYYRKKAIRDGTIGQKAESPVTFHEIFPPTHYRFAFKDQKIRDDFNLGLETIRKNQIFSQIMHKYETALLAE